MSQPQATSARMGGILSRAVVVSTPVPLAAPMSLPRLPTSQSTYM